MALFSDGLIADQEALRACEAGIISVLSSEAIALDSKLDLAQREIASEILAFLMRNAPQFVDPDRELVHVVVTEPLLRWHTQQSLADIYRDVYFRSLNDRYREKWHQYSKMSDEAKNTYLRCGVGVVRRPIPRLPAPQFEIVAGGSLPERTYLLSCAWHREGQVGLPSKPFAIQIRAGHLLHARAPEGSPVADAWSLYLGHSETRMYRQHANALTMGESWLESSDLIDIWPLAGRGQQPELYVSRRQNLERG